LVFFKVNESLTQLDLGAI